MLRFLFSAGILLMFLSAAGCDEACSDRVVFAVGGAPSELEAWEELAADFTRETGIRVEILRRPADTDQQRQSLILALNAGLSHPDVFLMDVVWVSLFAESGWLEPLDGFDPGPFFQSVIETVDLHEGKLVALPVYMDGGVLYYRRDLLDRFGLRPPETWAELLKSSLRVQNVLREKNPDFYGFVWQGAQYEGLITNFLEFAGSEGGFLLRDGRILLDLPANRRALEYMRDLIRKYRVSPPSTYTEMREEQARLYFQQGDALYERNWPYAWSLHQSPGSPVRGKTGIRALPSPAGEEAVSTLGGWHIGVSRFSNVKPQAMAFVRYVTSSQGQKKMVLRLGWNPGRQDLYFDPEILAALPYLAELKDVFRQARPRPMVPYYPQISNIAQRQINSALAGHIDAGEALIRAEREIAALLIRYGKPARTEPGE